MARAERWHGCGRQATATSDDEGFEEASKRLLMVVWVAVLDGEL